MKKRSTPERPWSKKARHDREIRHRALRGLAAPLRARLDETLRQAAKRATLSELSAAVRQIAEAARGLS